MVYGATAYCHTFSDWHRICLRSKRYACLPEHHPFDTAPRIDRASQAESGGTFTSVFKNLTETIMKYQSVLSSRVNAISAILLAAAVSQGAGAASFTGLGFLPGGTQSMGLTVSPTGAWVGGLATSGAGNEAARWNTKTQKLSRLGILPGYQNSLINAFSSNGTVAVGTASSLGTQEALRWTKKGFARLGFLPGNQDYSRAQAISADGSVIAGTAIKPGVGRQAVIWTRAKGMVVLGDLGGTHQSSGSGISADGKVVVGATSTATSAAVDTDAIAFRWTKKGGMVALGTLPNASTSRATGISANGKVAVGTCSTNGKMQACRWVGTGPAQGLGFISGYDNSVLWHTSRDGSVAVGQAHLINAVNQQIVSAAVIWDQTHGLRKLEDVLATDYGISTAGWKIESARGVSSDGKIIAGYGTNPSGKVEGWMVKLKR